MSEGSVFIEKLYNDIDTILLETNWNPKGMSPNSVLKLVETKACLLNARDKCEVMSDMESYNET